MESLMFKHSSVKLNYSQFNFNSIMRVVVDYNKLTFISSLVNTLHHITDMMSISTLIKAYNSA